MAKKDTTVTQVRTVYTHASLVGAAGHALDRAKNVEEGSFYECMAVLVFCAFAIEAYLNFLGERILPFWDSEMKRDLNTENKLKIICERVGVTVDHSERPFQTIKHAFKFRNIMAQAVSETIERTAKQAHREDGRYTQPKTWWESQCETAVAQRAYDDVKDVMMKLHKASGLKSAPFGIVSSSRGTAARTH